jgi:hypothetical protein
MVLLRLSIKLSPIFSCNVLGCLNVRIDEWGHTAFNKVRGHIFIAGIPLWPRNVPIRFPAAECPRLISYRVRDTPLSIRSGDTPS